MKFKDIKQFPFASYKVNVSWNYLPTWLERQKENFGVEYNPPYQRGYVWTKKQQIAYLEYQLRGGFSGKDIFFNHPDWMKIVAKSNKKLELVDGKQRIKAVLNFLNNKVKAFGYYYKEFEDKLMALEPDFIVHVNNLESEIEVVEWYLGMNNGGTKHTKKDIQVALDYLEHLKNKKND